MVRMIIQKLSLIFLFMLIEVNAMALEKPDSSWSSTVNGLSTRIILTTDKMSGDWPFISSFLELRNESEGGNVMEIPLDLQKFKFIVTDRNGKLVLPFTGFSYSGLTVDIGILRLPHNSSLKMNITSNKVGFHNGQHSYILDLGADKVWIFTKNGKNPFYLHGQYSVKEHIGTERRWFGVLEFPKIKVPLPD